MHDACNVINLQFNTLSFFTGGIIEAVCTCQLEVVLVAIVTGLVVHFVTKHAVQQKHNSRQDRSGSTAEPIGVVLKGDATYETVGGIDATGENVEYSLLQLTRQFHNICSNYTADRKSKTALVWLVCIIDS